MSFNDVVTKIDTHANWSTANPTLGDSAGGKDYIGFVVSTGGTYGNVLVFGKNEAYNTAYAAGQILQLTLSPTFSTVNTGQGDNELYEMDQDVKTTDDVVFNTLETTGEATFGGKIQIGGIAGDLVYSDDTQFEIKADTADDADTKRLLLCGGGASSSSRGGYIAIHGNEYLARPGYILLAPGSEGKIWTAGAGFYVGTAVDLHNGETFQVNGSAYIDVDIDIAGALSKGSGSFKIDHPLKPDTHKLVHSFVEAPGADLIYSGTVKLKKGKAEVNIDTEAGMTEGTFEALCREIRTLSSNKTGFTAVKSNVTGNILIIEAEDSKCTDTISWLVIGERKDKHMYDTRWTDKNGKVIVEPEKYITLYYTEEKETEKTLPVFKKGLPVFRLIEEEEELEYLEDGKIKIKKIKTKKKAQVTEKVKVIQEVKKQVKAPALQVKMINKKTAEYKGKRYEIDGSV